MMSCSRVKVDAVEGAVVFVVAVAGGVVGFSARSRVAANQPVSRNVRNHMA